MKKEYDFSNTERGKFYHKLAILRLPIYLDIKLQILLQKIAKKKHRELTEMVNHLVRKEVELIRKFA